MNSTATRNLRCLAGALWLALAGLACADGRNHYILDCAKPCDPSSAIGAPGAVATDAHGNVYFSSPSVVFKLTPDGIMRRIAGDGMPGFSGDGGLAVRARLNFPETYPERERDEMDFPELIGPLAVDQAGNVYIGDALNNRIRRIDSTGVIDTVAGLGEPGLPGSLVDMRFAWVQGLAAGPAGEMYVASLWGTVTRIETDGGFTDLVGWNCGFGFERSGVCVPKQIVLGEDGNVYLPDAYCRVRRMAPDGSVQTVAGHEGMLPNGMVACGGAPAEGTPAMKTSFSDPWAVAFTPAGEMLVADTYNECIRKIGLDGYVTTFAGRCRWAGFGGDGGPAREALLNRPHGIAVDLAGNVYIADTGNGRLRKVSPEGIVTTVAGNGRPFAP